MYTRIAKVINPNPDIILLGPNQRFDVKLLKDALKKDNLGHIKVKRLDQYYDKYELNSSSMIKRKIIESNNREYKANRIKTAKPNYNLTYGKI